MLCLKEKFRLILSPSDSFVLLQVVDDAEANVGHIKLDSKSKRFGATNIPSLGRA
jgi:hypothetical protein